MNVILLVVDTLRADHLSSYGYDRDTSPNLDKLQKTGARFEKAFIQCNFSGGSYASIFTGLYPHHHGVRDHPLVLDAKHDTLAELFERAGYRTFARHGHAYLGSRYQYDQGFEDYSYRLLAEKTTAESIDFLSQVGREKFFMFVQFKDPHYPYKPPKRFRRKWLQPPPYFWKRADALARNKTLLMFGFDLLDYRKDDFDYQVALYDGEIAYTDELLGRIDDALAGAGIRDNTIIVVTSDHGESLGEHGSVFNHDGSLYDEVTRVPLVIINSKLFPAPVTVSAPVQLIDILPSLADLTGLQDPTRRDGKSFLDLLDQPGETGETTDERLTFAEGRPLAQSRLRMRTPDHDPIPDYRVHLKGISGKWRSVRSATHKLILIPREPQPEWELYDLESDPGEQVNLYGRPEVRDQQNDLARALARWMADDSGIANEVEMTREVFEQLKEMGYVEGKFEDASAVPAEPR